MNEQEILKQHLILAGFVVLLGPGLLTILLNYKRVAAVYKTRK